LEQERAEQQSLVGKLQAQLQELQRTKTDYQLKLQQFERDLQASKKSLVESRVQQEQMAEMLTSGQTSLDLKLQVIGELEGQATC